MDPKLAMKIQGDYRLRELLRSQGLPQPDEVEYGDGCVRMLSHETKVCIVLDLEPRDGDSAA